MREALDVPLIVKGPGAGQKQIAIMAAKVLRALSAILSNAMEIGAINQNVAATAVQSVHVQLAPYADLAVFNVEAPAQTIGDPADRQALAGGFHQLVEREDRGLGVQRVEDRLDQEQIAAALE